MKTFFTVTIENKKFFTRGDMNYGKKHIRAFLENNNIAFESIRLGKLLSTPPLSDYLKERENNG